MEDQSTNKIKRLELENFTCFSKAAFDFSPGINVFIGENGTGKTHVLKVLYGILLTDKEYENRETVDVQQIVGQYFTKLWINWNALLNPNKLNSLVKKSHDYFKISFHLNEEPPLSFTFKNENNKTAFSIKKPYGTFNFGFESLFIPPNEILSWFKGFINLYKNKEVGFDKSYFELAVALDGPLLKGKAKEQARNLSIDLEQGIGAKIIKKDDGGFYLVFGDEQEIETSIVATGINKIAQLIYLIMNGSLTKDTILFWDEPEANLNPKYITLVAKFLQTLANAGCQIFVASHDYLLVHELSFLSEYRKEREMQGEKVPGVKFFALYKGEDGSSQVEEGESMSQIQNDAILDEYSAHDDREKAFWKTPYEKTSL